MAEPTGRYDAAYYQLMAAQGIGSAQAIVPLIAETYAPTSAVDVGCSEGYFLDAFKAAGVRDLHGVDGPFNDGRQVLANGHEFTVVDLQGNDLTLSRKFDLALCLETAEHLDAGYAAALVAGLVKLAPVVVFSAAVPGQFGEGHVNLQYPSYWASLFAEHGFWPSTGLRQRIWTDERVSWWYRQNLTVFSASHADGDAPLLDVVHPAMHDIARATPPTPPTGREGIAAVLRATKERALRRREP